MPHRIIFDGPNLALEEGDRCHNLCAYADPGRARSWLQRRGCLRFAAGSVQEPHTTRHCFFDEKRAIKKWLPKEILNSVADQVLYCPPVRPTSVDLSGVVVTRHFDDTVPAHDHIFVTRNLFGNAGRHFSLTNAFVDIAFDPRTDIFHHDLVPLGLPSTTR